MYIYLEEGQVMEENLLKKMEEAAGILFEQEGVDGERAEISLTLVSLEEIREFAVQEEKEDIYINELVQPILDEAAKKIKEINSKKK